MRIDWNCCEHEWEEREAQGNNEKVTFVECILCECPGEQDNMTKKVFWPAT